MMCFRDTAFCASNCANTACIRHFGEDDKLAADAWAKRLGIENGAPVAFADFSPECKDYLKPGTVAPVLKLKVAS